MSAAIISSWNQRRAEGNNAMFFALFCSLSLSLSLMTFFESKGKNSTWIKCCCEIFLTLKFIFYSSFWMSVFCFAWPLISRRILSSTFADKVIAENWNQQTHNILLVHSSFHLWSKAIELPAQRNWLLNVSCFVRVCLQWFRQLVQI